MKSYPLALCFILISFVIASAQDSKCTLDQAPELRGFRLGMTISEVDAKLNWGLSSVLNPADEIGVKEEAVGPLRLKDQEQARGIRKITLEFLDDRLSYIEVSYDDSVKWDSLDQFASKISEILKLPNEWEKPFSVSDDSSGNTLTATAKKLVCAGFNVGVILTSTNQAVLMLGEAGLKAAKEKRREVLKEKRQQSFKP